MVTVALLAREREHQRANKPLRFIRPRGWLVSRWPTCFQFLRFTLLFDTPRSGWFANSHAHIHFVQLSCVVVHPIRHLFLARIYLVFARARPAGFTIVASSRR